MCGIFGVLSTRAAASAPGDDLFQILDRLVEETQPASLSLVLEKDTGAEEVFRRLDEAQEAASRWMGRGAFLDLLFVPGRAARLEAAAARALQWARGLEDLCERGWTARQSHREIINRLIVGGKDIAWRIQKDILENISSVRALVEGDDRLALTRAFELNLLLGSLDRLEVRGRDSAGVALFVRFASAAALDAFLDGVSGGSVWRREVEARRDLRFGHRAVIRPGAFPSALLLAFKVASEVGKMGDNAAYLRKEIAGDPLLQALLREPGVELQCLGHTRWASNGIISVSNCHPVESAILEGGQGVHYSEGRLVAVLNGDIDNYRELVERYVRTCDAEIDPSITTDAKIIPLVVSHHLSRVGDLEEAFRLACAEFQGSMAIGLMAADRPGELLFAQKGSGQGLFFGLGHESIAVASEMYGIVEVASRYIKAEGERSESGEIFRVRAEEGQVRLEVLGAGGFQPVATSRIQTAEITTRDIDRGEYPHFFLKEISGSVESVRNTLRGKFELPEMGGVRFLLGQDVLPVELIAGLREGRVRQISLVGQGTAAVAAQGVAHLLQTA
ncbi:MAG: hypothetical protein JXA90_12290, partial [Planctomycetes bacterium]|nr:hypothetical protein [Planctomycetota bacterium]